LTIGGRYSDLVHHRGKKIPVLIELDLPVGDVTFELESMEGVKMAEQDRRRKAFERHPI